MLALTLQQWLLAARQAAVPLAAALAILFISLLPWHMPGLGEIATILTLGAVFFWTLRRPEAFSPWSAALLGLSHDGLGLLPLGTGFLLCLLLRQATLALRSRLDFMPFFLVWGGFALLFAGAAALAWLLLSLHQGIVLPAGPAFRFYLLGLLLYPPLAYALAALERAFLPRR